MHIKYNKLNQVTIQLNNPKIMLLEQKLIIMTITN